MLLMLNLQASIVMIEMKYVYKSTTRVYSQLSEFDKQRYFKIFVLVENTISILNFLKENSSHENFLFQDGQQDSILPCDIL